ncbi:uncharacterized protein LOC130625909 [Hydractinia symbiolongicarpus]|uniref:uncharacterized protein LOC130625909 n=1 Tax=Hydractinia symbiolongicarpus TaxID=13093 RepID=UPI00254D96BB|nr:uncharacterized protein LOC130625909 [Hydractinia symbiolongicarpus]
MKVMKLVIVLLLQFGYLIFVKGQCMRRTGTRYYKHFAAYKLSENSCMKRCHSNSRCYKATWTAGKAAHNYFNCFLHPKVIDRATRENAFVGYICKADCQKDGQRFTSQNYQLTSNCKSKCKCTLLGAPTCYNPCLNTVVNCVSPNVKVHYDIPLDSKCSCAKQACVVPGNFSIEAKQGQTTALSCSFESKSWTRSGRILRSGRKYNIKKNSIEIWNFQPTDSGVYTCGDKKYYKVYLTEATCKDGGSTYTSEKFTASVDCKQMCKCSITEGLSCFSLCPFSSINCSNGHTNISYKEPPLKDSKCLCRKQACVRPENPTLNFTTKENVVLKCSFPDMAWTFDGKKIKNNTKYKINGTSLEITNLESSDNGVYSCNDGKTYFLSLSKDEIMSSPRNSGTSNNLNAVLIVVCTAVVVLVLPVVIFIFVKRIYQHRKIPRENQNTHPGENSASAKTNEAFYSELTSRHVPSKYSELNIDPIKTSSYESHVYEVNPYVIESQCERYAVPTLRRGKHNNLSDNNTEETLEEDQTFEQKYSDSKKPAMYISLGDINDKKEQHTMKEQYEISSDLIFGSNRHSFSLPCETDCRVDKNDKGEPHDRDKLDSSPYKCDEIEEREVIANELNSYFELETESNEERYIQFVE